MAQAAPPVSYRLVYPSAGARSVRVTVRLDAPLPKGGVRRFRQTLREAPLFLRRLGLVELSRVASTRYSEDFRTGQLVFSRDGRGGRRDRQRRADAPRSVA